MSKLVRAYGEKERQAQAIIDAGLVSLHDDKRSYEVTDPVLQSDHIVWRDDNFKVHCTCHDFEQHKTDLAYRCVHQLAVRGYLQGGKL